MEYHSKEENYFKYLPVAETDKLWQLFTTTVGRTDIKPGETYPYKAGEHPPSYTLNWNSGRILNEYQFVYVLKGSGRFKTFLGERIISPGTVLLLIPGERHWYQPDSNTGWTEYWIGFRGEWADRWLERKFLDRENPVYRPGVSKSLLALFDEAVCLAKSEPPCMQQLISSIVPRIQAKLYAGRKSEYRSDSEDNVFARACVLFEEHIYDKFDIEEITSVLSVNYYTLRESFNQHTGMSPYHYFLQMKINRAKELLERGSMSVKEVSFRLAFDSPYYFSRLFKKKTGVSPSRWNGSNILSDLELWDDSP